MQHPYYQEPSIRRRATPSPIPNHDGQHWTQLPPSPSDLQSTWRPPAHGRHNEFPPRPSSPRTGAPFRSESWFPIPLTPKADGRQLPPPHSYLRSHSSSSRDTLDWNLTLCDNTYEKGSRLSLLRKIPPLPIKLTDKYPTGNLKLSLQKNSVHSKDREKLDLDICNRWTSSKWWLLLGSISVFLYGLAGIGCAVITWLQAWPLADVLLVTDPDILVLITTASIILVLTSLVGLAGTLLSSRRLLSVYALLLWPALISLLAIGYAAYKRSTFSLDRKLNLAWSQWYTPLGRLVIQDALGCCGYTSALHGQTPSKRCYVRTPLPGCKGALLHFERGALGTIAATVFSLVPLHLLNIVVSLLCANHVTAAFGNGIMPRQYRLYGTELERMWKSLEDMGVARRPRATEERNDFPRGRRGRA